MTSPITPVGSGGFGDSLIRANPGTLDKEDFLELLVAQLRHQDPLNPMDGTQFASQLAEFSGLEQLIQLNDALVSQSSGDTLTQLAINTDLGASLIGRTVLGFGNEIEMDGSGSYKVVVNVGGSGGTGTIEIADEQGVVVATRSLGVVAGGDQQVLEFDIDEDLPPGGYRYRVTVSDTDGTAVPVEHFTIGKVQGVFFDDNGIMLRVSDHVRLSLNNLAEIEPAVDWD